MQANDEISPSFFLCLSSVSLLSPPPTTLYQCCIPHWPPPSPHPALKLWCRSCAAYFSVCSAAPSQVLFDLILDQLNGEFTFCMMHCSNTSVTLQPCFVFTLWMVNLSPVHCCCLFFTVRMNYCLSNVSSWSVSALYSGSHCPSLKSYSTGLVCFGWSDCAIKCWSCAVLHKGSSVVMKLFCSHMCMGRVYKRACGSSASVFEV